MSETDTRLFVPRLSDDWEKF